MEILSRANSPKILNIGPSRTIIKWLQGNGFDVTTVDIAPNLAQIRMDITRSGFGDSVFDLILCSHVLEHIKDDSQAIRELSRILKQRGICIIQVPLHPDLVNTVEYPGPKEEEFGHVRTYGQDFVSRLDNKGFDIINTEHELFHLTKVVQSSKV
jgi:SAM-dependent methyltransferase